jgi:hypothetical protein
MKRQPDGLSSAPALKTVFFITAMIACSFFPAAGQTPCGPPPIDTGFGAPGPYSVVSDSFTNPPVISEFIHVFYPRAAAGKCPVIFLCQRYGIKDPQEYATLINHIVSRGYVVIMPSIRPVLFTRVQLDKYENGYLGFREAVARFASIIDTTRIGFVGHGFGAGMAPSIARSMILDDKWGQTAAFLYLMSPWYVYNIDERQLATFPAHVKLIVQDFSDDNINDPHIAEHLFLSFGVPPGEKEFFIMYGDRWGDCVLNAGNSVPEGPGSTFGEENALDYYGIYRTFDALAAYTYAGSQSAKAVALGSGVSRTCFMGQWPDGIPIRPMIATDNPQPYTPKALYVNSWQSPRNPQIESSKVKKATKVELTFVNKKIKNVAKFGEKKIQAALDKKEPDIGFTPNPIDSGYGADGDYGVLIDSLPSPLYKNGYVYFFHPADTARRYPTLFLQHGYSGGDPNDFQPFINHIVSRGINVVFSPYPILPAVKNVKTTLEKYTIAFAGVDAAIDRFGMYIDTSRVGFFGQSFGGGIVPSLAWKILMERNWGQSGAFIFLSAPWFPFNISQRQLQSFRRNVKLLIQVYDDDVINDHQIAIDIFNNLSVPASEKDYCIMYSDSLDGTVLPANHFVAYGPANIYGTLDQLDFYGIFRLFDALAEYSLNGNASAKVVALGHGSPQQCFMGTWSNGTPIARLVVNDNPRAYHPELSYFFNWDNPLNPRRNLADSTANPVKK